MSRENVQPSSANEEWEILRDTVMEQKGGMENICTSVEHREPLCPSRFGRRRGIGTSRPSLCPSCVAQRSQRRTHRGALGTAVSPKFAPAKRERARRGECATGWRNIECFWPCALPKVCTFCLKTPRVRGGGERGGILIKTICHLSSIRVQTSSNKEKTFSNIYIYYYYYYLASSRAEEVKAVRTQRFQGKELKRASEFRRRCRRSCRLLLPRQLPASPRHTPRSFAPLPRTGRAPPPADGPPTAAPGARPRAGKRRSRTGAERPRLSAAVGAALSATGGRGAARHRVPGR